VYMCVCVCACVCVCVRVCREREGREVEKDVWYIPWSAAIRKDIFI